jgi:mono/diheme cytochrome c family protein
MSTSKSLQRLWRALAAAAPLSLAFASGPAPAAEGNAGKEILESNCGRCHAVAADAKSLLKQAPNLFVVLGSYPLERLEVELA